MMILEKICGEILVIIKRILMILVSLIRRNRRKKKLNKSILAISNSKITVKRNLKGDSMITLGLGLKKLIKMILLIFLGLEMGGRINNSLQDLEILMILAMWNKINSKISISSLKMTENKLILLQLNKKLIYLIWMTLGIVTKVNSNNNSSNSKIKIKTKTLICLWITIPLIPNNKIINNSNNNRINNRNNKNKILILWVFIKIILITIICMDKEWVWEWIWECNNNKIWAWIWECNNRIWIWVCNNRIWIWACKINNFNNNSNNNNNNSKTKVTITHLICFDFITYFI